ncbi:MAG TPA: radical SAM protein [Polyangiales bacterium]|nr:radical SAM protein [Polyangiales bacterium]
MALLRKVLRLVDDKPWSAHLYVTERCNLDCHYCNEYDNSVPHPTLAELTAWMQKMRALGVERLAIQGGEPLLHPDIAAVVRTARELGFYKVSMSTNGLLLSRELLAQLEAAGLDQLQMSVDRVTPVESTRKSLKSVAHKLPWFKGSRIELYVGGVLFSDTLDEMAQLIDSCLDQDVPVQMRVVHDDLIHKRKLRDPAARERLLAFIGYQERLKRNGEPIVTSWNIIDYQKRLLKSEPVDWTCVAGYKYFFVSARGQFWLCSQVRTERHILDVTPEDLRANNRKKDCQSVCGVYCTIDSSLRVNHPVRYLRRELSQAAAQRAARFVPGRARRMRDFVPRASRP